MQSIESMLYDYLKKYDFISDEGKLKFYSKFGDDYSNHVQIFFEHYLKTKNIEIISYTCERCLDSYGEFATGNPHTIFAWYDGEKIEMCSFVEEV